MQFRHTPITVSLNGSKLTVAAHADSPAAPIRVGVGNVVRELSGGETATFTIGRPETSPTLSSKHNRPYGG